MIELTLTLKTTAAQVVEMSVTVNNNSPIQEYVHRDNQTQPTLEMTPGFRPFTVLITVWLMLIMNKIQPHLKKNMLKMNLYMSWDSILKYTLSVELSGYACVIALMCHVLILPFKLWQVLKVPDSMNPC